MANATEIYKRRKRLLDIIRISGPVDQTELKKSLRVGTRTLLNDIRFLRDSGFEIEIRKYKIILRSETSLHKPSTEQDVRKTKILMLISDYPGITKQKLKDAVCEPIRDDYFDVTNTELIDVRNKLALGQSDEEIIRLYGGRTAPLECFRKLDSARKTFFKDLHSLEQENMISIDNGHCNLSFAVLRTVYYSPKSLKSIYRALINNGDTQTFSPILKRLATKIEDVIENRLGEEPEKYQKAQLIRDNRRMLENYSVNLDKITSLPYKTKKLFVIAINNRDTPYSKIISVGKIIYLCNTGKMFLFGREENGRWSSIEVSKIQEIHSIDDQPNAFYNSEEVNKLCAQMLGSTVEKKPHTIRLLFPDEPEIKKELSDFCETRGKESKARIEPWTNGSFLYTDEICGIYEMAKIVRKFGASCQVLEDRELKDMMMQSASEMLRRYQNDK